MPKILLVDWNVGFSMDDEREKLRMKERMQMNWQLLLPLWVLEVKKCLLKNMHNWQGRILLM